MIFDLTEDFVTESSEGLAMAADDVLSLEQNPDQEAIDSIFRVVHTIKGTAGMFGFTALSGFVHSLEDTCSDLRSGNRMVDRQAADCLLNCLDFIQLKLNFIRDAGHEDEDYFQGEILLKSLQADSSKPESSHDQKKLAVEPARFEMPPSPDSMNEFLRLIGNDKPRKTLIVEDDFASRKQLYSYLSQFTICHVAKDGCEAIQAVTESYIGSSPEPFLLIFMNARLPIIDGLRATRAIRAIEYAKRAESNQTEAWICIISEEDDRQIVNKAIREYDANAVLSTPLDHDELKRMPAPSIFHSIHPDLGKGFEKALCLSLKK